MLNLKIQILLLNKYNRKPDSAQFLFILLKMMETLCFFEYFASFFMVLLPLTAYFFAVPFEGKRHFLHQYHKRLVRVIAILTR